MAIEFVRNVLGNIDANSLEFDENCAPNDVVTLLESQKGIYMMGGTMRL
jgi:CTP synthase (UTP-ammonia lyase)